MQETQPIVVIARETNEDKTIRVTNDFLIGVNNMMARVDRSHEGVADECDCE